MHHHEAGTITGQDGSGQAELHLAMGCEVHGVIRRAPTCNTSRIDHPYRDSHGIARRAAATYVAFLTEKASGPLRG